MRSFAAAIIVIALAASAARADLPPITSRDYAIDLYNGAALGSVRIVGMGGAALAGAEGSPGTMENPASAAVRTANSTTIWDWDWHFDAQQAIYASDLDNNGRDRGGDTRLATFGLLGNYGDWAVGLAASTQGTRFGDSASELEATATRGRIVLARSFLNEEYTVGVMVESGTFKVSQGLAQASHALFEIEGSGFGIGAVWRPWQRNWRVGASASTAVSGDAVSVEDCDPMNCNGLVLPDRVEAPWTAGVGVAYRWGEAGWNQYIAGMFRDERVVMVAADLVVSGPVAGGLGLEAFGEGLAQRSGAHAVVSPRGGVEYEIWPGHVRLRGGSYWEPSRFDGVGGRAHGTAGVEFGAINVKMFGVRRMRVTFTADLAPRYGTATVSFGFWH